MATSATDHYEVRFRETGTLGWSKTYRAPAVAELALDGLDRGKQYDYEVRAVSACGAKSVWVGGNYTVPIAPTLPAPGTLTTQGKQDAVDLDWSEPDGIRGDLSYQVQRGTSGSGPWTDIAKVKATRWTDKVPDTATNYYRVRVLDFFGNVGAWSAVVTGAATSVSPNTGEISISANLITNSDFGGISGELYPWSAAGGTNTDPITFRNYKDVWSAPAYKFPDGGNFEVHQTGTDTGDFTWQNLAPVPVEVGQRYEYWMMFASHRCTALIYLAWLDAAGVAVGYSPVVSVAPNYGGGDQSLSSYIKTGGFDSCPAGAVSARMFFRTNGTSSGTESSIFGAQAYLGKAGAAQTEFTNWSPGPAFGLDELSHGPTYGKPYNGDLYDYGGFRRIGMRVPGSGQRIGDQRNLPQITIGNGKAKVPTVITYSSTPTAATISVAAFTILAGSFSVAYSASSVGVTGTGGTTVTYFLYRDDPNYAGGSTGALVATTSGDNIYGNDGRVFIGTVDVFFPASGSGGGGGGRPLCVCTDMYLLDDLMAAEARPGLVLDCIDLPTSSRPFQRAIANVEFAEAECVSLTTDGGARWDGSEDTPFDLIDGRKALAVDMLGEQVVTDWGVETVVGVEPLGMQPVAHISVGGVSYAAGAEAGHRIYSHNLDKP